MERGWHPNGAIANGAIANGAIAVSAGPLPFRRHKIEVLITEYPKNTNQQSVPPHPSSSRDILTLK